MPRQPRIDAPGMVHHVIARGIERSRIFLDDEDRDFFLRRLGELVVDTEDPAYAFALIPNHFHLLVRSAKTPLATLMRRLLTGYAVHFNRKYRRSGHLFQNRYKSVPCTDEIYFAQLLRYINLNPVRAELCPYSELAHYRYSAHSCLMGKQHLPWIDAGAALALFGKPNREARRAYAEFVAAGLGEQAIDICDGAPSTWEGADGGEGVNGNDGRRKSSQGSCLIYEKNTTNIFSQADIDRLFRQTCLNYDVTTEEIHSNGKTRMISLARIHLAKTMSRQLGLNRAQIASYLGVQHSAVSKMLKRGD